jgi:methionyl-tRNA formyltransferase
MVVCRLTAYDHSDDILEPWLYTDQGFFIFNIHPCYGEEKMRIIFIGQAPFGAESLQKLINQREDVIGIITIPDKPGQKHANPVQQCAAEHGIPVLQSRLLKNPEAISWVKELDPDLLVLAFVTSFVPQEMIDCARYGGINYHPSLLPAYRGGSAINWAIINGEIETGVTIHFIDEGVDTGPILLQEKVSIGPDDTVKSLYFEKLYPMGIRMIGEAVQLIKTGSAQAIAQDETHASFQPVITPADTVINWHKPTHLIYNLIRGANPAPGASTSINDTTCKLFDTSRGDGSGNPGEVINITDTALEIATADGSLLVYVIQPSGSKKVPAQEFAQSAQLKTGDRFNSSF